jgi:spore coat polysaccharide biosynthesis protein SpsF (cytidylyltransferase family)
VEYGSNIEPPTFPDGLDVEIFTKKALEKAYIEAKMPSEREHVTPFIRNYLSKTNYALPTDYSKFRFTVDEQEDFNVIKRLIEDI